MRTGSGPDPDLDPGLASRSTVDTMLAAVRTILSVFPKPAKYHLAGRGLQNARHCDVGILPINRRALSTTTMVPSSR